MSIFILLFEAAQHLAALLAGGALVAFTLNSAIRTFVLPRAASDSLTNAVFMLIRKLFALRLKKVTDYPLQDRIMALYAPAALMALLPTWYLLVMLGYMLMFWAVGIEDWYLAFRDSGSSLLTLGFEPVNGLALSILAFSEAVIGLILVALLIAYLPTMYAAFSRRESAVTMLEVRAGDPPSAVEMVKRYYRIHGLHQLGEMWQNWEEWFADLQESHTSLAALVFFRSPKPSRSWVTAAGAVLDAAALTLSVVDIPQDWRANLCLRAGFLALRDIADLFDIRYDRNPQPGDPISIERSEFEAAVAELAEQGVPLKVDLELAWRDFSGWRVNYDRVLIALAQITLAPPAPWISDGRRTPA